MFLCTSYDYGYTHNLAKQESDHWGNKFDGVEGKTTDKTMHGNAPLVILPEWPLPLEVFIPETPTLALTARFRPFNEPVHLSGSEEFHFYHHGAEPSSHKIMVNFNLPFLVAEVIYIHHRKQLSKMCSVQLFSDPASTFSLALILQSYIKSSILIRKSDRSIPS